MADSRFDVSLTGYTFDPLDEQPNLPEELRADPRFADPQRYIVQVNRTITREDQEHLQGDYGLQLTEYIPPFAYLEQLSKDTHARLQQDPLVRAIVVFEPAYKISPGIGELKFETPERQRLRGILLDAVLFPEANPTSITAVLQQVGARDILVLDDRQIGGEVRVRFVAPSANIVPEIAQRQEVRWIEEVPEIKRDNGFTAGTIQSGTQGNEIYWNRGLRGDGQIIGIIDEDTLDMNHCCFIDNVNNTPNPAHRKVVGLRNSSMSGTGDHHASFVAGIAAGDDVNNPGAATNRGNAWAACITYGNQRDLSSATLYSYLVAAMNDRAAIHSNSWHLEPGHPQYDQTFRDVDRFVWDNEDNLVIGSAGNRNENFGPPGTAKNALCVAASERFPNHMNLSDGNPGPTNDIRPRRKPEIVAPGCNINSAKGGTSCSIRLWAPSPFCATSWATPAVAAAAAMVRQYFLEGWYPTGTQKSSDSRTPSGALLKATLLNSTVDMTGVDWHGNALSGYPGNLEGWGRLELNQSLYFAGDMRKLWVQDVRRINGLSSGESATHHVVVATNAAPLKITLVWSDPPALANNDDPVVNNLDLIVRSPGGSQTFLGNHFVNGESSPGGAPDDRNNVEMVLINNPMPGDWRITVRASSVSIPEDQSYALVATGDIAEVELRR